MPKRFPPHLAEVFLLFLRLGFTAFGGPAAHVAIMHDEVVKRRQWLDDQQFLDLLGATNLIPGPNSTEMAIHLGYLRAGWPGLIAGGFGFVVPATLIVLLLAWAYAEFGTLPQVGGLLYGIKPVVIAIIVQALWSLGGKALKSLPAGLVAAAVLGLYFLGINEIVLLFAGGLAVMLAVNLRQLPAGAAGILSLPLSQNIALPGPDFGSLQKTLSRCRDGTGDFRSLWASLTGAMGAALVSTPFSLPLLFLTFLKIGSVLYGSGYVLLAFLRTDLVVRYGWLTDQQLLDAIAIGQVTPGPLFTTATFIGYQLGSVPGALLATLGIFLPSFIFVAISNPFIPRLRRSPWLGALLDGVIAASLGLMAAVTWQIGIGSLVDPLTILVALVSLVLLLRFKVNSTWLIAGGALIGLITVVLRL